MGRKYENEIGFIIPINFQKCHRTVGFVLFFVWNTKLQNNEPYILFVIMSLLNATDNFEKDIGVIILQFVIPNKNTTNPALY